MAELRVGGAGLRQHHGITHRAADGMTLYRAVAGLPDHVHVPDAFRRLYHRGALHHRHDADIRAAEADGEQQPRQHQQPQGVL